LSASPSRKRERGEQRGSPARERDLEVLDMQAAQPHRKGNSTFVGSGAGAGAGGGAGAEPPRSGSTDGVPSPQQQQQLELSIPGAIGERAQDHAGHTGQPHLKPRVRKVLAFL
jgi:hypothetical protein